jgi:protein FAM32A
MAGDEYSVGGGKLKLKGSKVSGGRIEKKKKKSTKKKEGEATQSKSESTPDTERPQSEKDEGVTSGEDRERERERDAPGKTEAEKRAEEIRRKRVCFLSFFLFPRCLLSGRDVSTSALLDRETDFSEQLHERLQREGVKTHKERVEELNKYLSRLSEHHDMYVFTLCTVVHCLWAFKDKADLLYRPKIGPG